METTPEEASPKSLVSCDSANAYTSLAPATEVEGTPRATQTKQEIAAQDTLEYPFVDIASLSSNPGPGTARS